MIDPTLESLQLLIEANDRRLNDLMKERELRDQQRYDASRNALDAALGCAKEAITKAEAAYENALTTQISGNRRSLSCRVRWSPAWNIRQLMMR